MLSATPEFDLLSLAMDAADEAVDVDQAAGVRSRRFSEDSAATSCGTLSPSSSPAPLSVVPLPLSLELPTPRRDEDALALRRKRNREAMRRTRQRERETIASLRQTVTRLETQYATLTATWNGPAVAPDGAGAQLAAFDATLERRAQLRDLEARLQQLVQLRRELEAENAATKELLAAKHAQLQTLQAALDEYQLDDMVQEKLALLEEEAAQSARKITAQLASSPGFVALSPLQTQSLLTAFCDELERIKALRWPTPSPSTLPRPPAGAPPYAPRTFESAQLLVFDVFGWHTRRHINPATNEMHFEISKVFPVSADEMTERSWTSSLDLEAFRRKGHEMRIRRLERLQVVSDNVLVLVREIEHPVDPTVVFRTHFLAFRMRRGDTWVIGQQSINPVAPQPPETAPTAERVVWVDVFAGVEVRPLDEATCEVRWRGRTNYKSLQHAAENAVRFLTSVVRWEADLMGPLFRLLSS
ncbi:hypothetical protein P43SY_002892 [Pythium insidiosum]|uniref:BZIP domain-containing protein n=1 Tax=Pythium insidiosum TaxID=114742 RepID=A0AAD5LAE8_PYTIN|nr:hypothetical protein P43SY_002892 [Pythium insidiosum]